MKLCVSMPAWNEVEGISEFIEEIARALPVSNPIFVIIDDCSTDKTAEVLHSLDSEKFTVIIETNEKNMGHGPSTLRGLRRALREHPDFVIAIDGDGQFLGSDVAKCLNEFLAMKVDLVEGIRMSREDPWFRKVSTHATRLLVWTRCGSLPTDANTPLRIYKAEVLELVLDQIPSHSLTPNLFISAITRKRSVSRLEVPVTFIPRRGVNIVGTSWGTKRKKIPSKRFIKFCFSAAIQWLKFNGRIRAK